MNKYVLRAPKLFWVGALAYALTLLTGGIWLALIVGNLKTTPSIPWSIVVMAALLWAIWQFLNGKWKPESTSGIRHHLMRANSVPQRTLVWALLAGIFSIIALVGFWTVLSGLVKLPRNATLDSSSYPWYFSLLVAVMASLSGSITEEIGFRGYFQKALEMRGNATLAIIIAALVIFPAHALTQGFIWPVLVFYLLVDIMLGTMAYLTNSILPGIVVHALGLFVFLFLVWPNPTRRLVFESGPNIWFWVNVVQMIIFAAAALWAFKRLAHIATHDNRPLTP
jgi:membrane protease YdiL (CAAX protease family)